MLHSDNDLQDNLIVAHPMLAGKKAQNNQLTDFSTTEQKSAGLGDCTDSEIRLFEELNNEYFSKFNFPFIMAVKEKNKSDIILSFKERKENSRLDERSNALNEINKIAWLRIKEIYGL
jgi:OHCU decarboxylase